MLQTDSGLPDLYYIPVHNSSRYKNIFKNVKYKKVLFFFFTVHTKSNYDLANIWVVGLYATHATKVNITEP